MARPKQDGLLYFSFDTDFFYADKRIKRLHSKYGNDGLIFYIYLLTEIYRNGYYISWDEESAEDATEDLRLREGFTEQVLTYLASRSLLTVSKLASSVTIVTSPGIQKRYQEAKKGCKRQIEVNPEIWLLSEEETASCIKVMYNPSNSEKNPSNSEKNPSNSEKNPIKESKGKEKNNICAPEPHESGKKTEYDQLVIDFEKIYAIYPKKVGRTVAFANYKQWVSPKGKNVGGKWYRLTNRQIYIAVRNYVRKQRENGQDDLQYWKNFDTLMGRQLLDYVNWKDGKK